MMRCRHYKGDGYRYEFNGETIALCTDCETELLKKMVLQTIDEAKMPYPLQISKGDKEDE